MPWDSEWPLYYYDNGCKAATKHLGRQSKCIDCPFAECAYFIKGFAFLVPLASKVGRLP